MFGNSCVLRNPELCRAGGEQSEVEIGPLRDYQARNSLARLASERIAFDSNATKASR